MDDKRRRGALSVAVVGIVAFLAVLLPPGTLSGEQQTPNTPRATPTYGPGSPASSYGPPSVNASTLSPARPAATAQQPASRPR